MKLLLLLLISTTAFAEDYFLNLKGKPTQGGLIIAQTNSSAAVKINGKNAMLNTDGYFMFGFGRFDEEPIKLQINYQGMNYTATIAVTPREFPTEVIDGLPANKVTPPAKVYAQINSDNAKVAQARSFVDKRDDFLQQFIWPSDGRVSGVYGSRRILNGVPKRPHYGMDIANVTGTKVIAPAAGIVRLAETGMYYTGGTIIIDHGYGLTTTFIHLNKVDVESGSYVAQGEKIGEIGATGRATGPHLDWRLNLGKIRLDPQLIILPK
ncbi:Peptidase, M23/M37 family [hydrothermal vent metagenome]|uniref:Peptidase, M23/M37 family n=1 Tax=hydrothermal vent metagenome TaxID=652676 RepID=A0A3B0UTX9_9ZZZZ